MENLDEINWLSGIAQHSQFSSRLARLAEHQVLNRREVAEHALNVAKTSRDLATHIGFTQSVIDEIYMAALWHDIGKLVVPEEVLNKRERLSDDELITMRTHARVGSTLLGEDVPATWTEVARYHHERYDGRGYEGLSGESIPLSARLVSIADVHDALVSQRSYKDAMTEEDAILLMTKDAESPQFGRRAFDPFLLRSFVKARLGDPDFHASSESRALLEAYTLSEPMEDLEGGYEANDGWHIKASGHRIRYEHPVGGNRKMMEMRGPKGELIYYRDPDMEIEHEIVRSMLPG